ncbi:MAG: hypothetical protein QNJ31_05525 [Candidatus Caenarcaniphilales bacterium]|nr:hypothetical protein [Candidatus Caenarcaniphilales bacterium]
MKNFLKFYLIQSFSIILCLVLPAYSEDNAMSKIIADSDQLCEKRFENNEEKQKLCKEKMHDGFLEVTGFLMKNKIDKLDIQTEMEKGNWMAQIFAACSAKWKRPEGFYWDKINKCLELEVEAFNNKERDYSDDN